MKIAIITSRYPKEKQPYNHMFVHTRNKEYLNIGIEVDVFIPSKCIDNYHYEGINIYLENVIMITKRLSNYDAVLIHLVYHSIYKEIDAGYILKNLLEINIPTLFFIHGIEAQKIGINRKEDISLFKPRSIARYIYKDYYQIPLMSRDLSYLIEKHEKICFIFPSEWMRKNAEESLNISFKKKYKIIPNGIDTEAYKFIDHWQNRHKTMTIRPLILKGKYALDLALKTFDNIPIGINSLDIYGDGPDYDEILKLSQKRFINSNIIRGFLSKEQIIKLHREYGIYFGVTRMDAQGVSMCEAMASGLPVVSFDTCAIPEFIRHEKTGLLIKKYSIEDAKEAILTLMEDIYLYQSITENARMFIEKIDIKKTVIREMRIFELI